MPAQQISAPSPLSTRLTICLVLLRAPTAEWAGTRSSRPFSPTASICLRGSSTSDGIRIVRSRLDVPPCPVWVAATRRSSTGSGLPSSRSQRMRRMRRLDHGAGIQPLVQLATGNITSWVGKESMTVLARSGDPRARQFLRSTVQRTDLSDGVIASALRGLGREYVTAQDASLLRSLYPHLTGQRSQDAGVALLSALGGS